VATVTWIHAGGQRPEVEEKLKNTQGNNTSTVEMPRITHLGTNLLDKTGLASLDKN